MARGRRTDLARAAQRGKSPLIREAISEVINQAISEVIQTARQGVVEGAANTLRPLSKKDAKQVKSYIDSHIVEFYDRLGARAWNAMVDSLSQQEWKTDRSGYAVRHNRLSGRLSAAFSRDFFHADQTGLYFGDRDRLYSIAAHWHRITFGAAPIGGGIHADFPLTYQGTAVGRISLDGGPSPAFAMPPGIWVHDVFFPVASHRLASMAASRPEHLRPHPTKGIRGHDFISPGLKVLAEEFGPELDKLIEGAEREILKGIPRHTRTTVRSRGGKISPMTSGAYGGV